MQNIVTIDKNSKKSKANESQICFIVTKKQKWFEGITQDNIFVRF